MAERIRSAIGCFRGNWVEKLTFGLSPQVQRNPSRSGEVLQNQGPIVDQAEQRLSDQGN